VCWMIAESVCLYGCGGSLGWEGGGLLVVLE